MKVLMVDDDPVERVRFGETLSALGHEAVLAPDGIEALNILKQEPIRLVVCDWIMPDMDGLELCRRVREHSTDYVYFILLTNRSASLENKGLAVTAGVDDFLSKPEVTRDLEMRLFVAERILNHTKPNKQLDAYIPICSYCKKIRATPDQWQQLETYITQRTGSRFSHTICPDCYKIQVPLGFQE